jgi:hypothetical protein
MRGLAKAESPDSSSGARIFTGEIMNKPFDFLRTKRIEFVDVDGNVLSMDINEIELDKSYPCFRYLFNGNNGAENCSGTDMNGEIRFMKNECFDKDCCFLPKGICNDY